MFSLIFLCIRMRYNGFIGLQNQQGYGLFYDGFLRGLVCGVFMDSFFHSIRLISSRWYYNSILLVRIKRKFTIIYIYTLKRIYWPFLYSCLWPSSLSFCRLCLALLTFSGIRYVLFNLTLAMVCYTTPLLLLTPVVICVLLAVEVLKGIVACIVSCICWNRTN